MHGMGKAKNVCVYFFYLLRNFAFLIKGDGEQTVVLPATRQDCGGAWVLTQPLACVIRLLVSEVMDTPLWGSSIMKSSGVAESCGQMPLAGEL